MVSTQSYMGLTAWGHQLRGARCEEGKEHCPCPTILLLSPGLALTPCLPLSFWASTSPSVTLSGLHFISDEALLAAV